VVAFWEGCQASKPSFIKYESKKLYTVTNVKSWFAAGKWVICYTRVLMKQIQINSNSKCGSILRRMRASQGHKLVDFITCKQLWQRTWPMQALFLIENSKHNRTLMDGSFDEIRPSLLPFPKALQPNWREGTPSEAVWTGWLQLLHVMVCGREVF
jgi:hypothetical protein